jgi:FkbM family methyltransferase
MNYSQNNEQQLIQQYFGEAKGTVLDIGANDGKTLSNSLACIERGWAATLVEPSEKCFGKLTELHNGNSNVECFRVAIADKCADLEFHESGEHAKQYYGENHSLLSSLKKEETKKWTSEVFTPTVVKAIDFETLIRESKFKEWSLISIDAEGFDWEILIQINLNAVRCNMLIVENNGAEQGKYIKYCEGFGMRLYSTTPQNLIFVR